MAAHLTRVVTGMRRPSWNKSQAIQQVISLKALLETTDDSGAGALRKILVSPPETTPRVSTYVYILFSSLSLYICKLPCLVLEKSLKSKVSILSLSFLFLFGTCAFVLVISELLISFRFWHDHLNNGLCNFLVVKDNQSCICR